MPSLGHLDLMKNAYGRIRPVHRPNIAWLLMTKRVPAMNRRFDATRLLALVAFLLLIFLGFYFGALRVREAGGSVVSERAAEPQSTFHPMRN